MFNKSTFITLLALFLLGSLTYAIKQKVMELDDKLAGIHGDMAQYQESMHVLNAEWAYLTRPSRLQALVEEHTGMYHSPGVALVSYDDVFSGGASCDSGSDSIRLASVRGSR